MEVLFRAEVIGIGSMAESRIKKLTQIGNRFYCIGFESLLDGQYVIVDKDENCFECKYDTRAIHFEDMLDSQGNKIFASLNVKGGSLLEYEGTIYEVMYLNYLIQGVTNMHSIKSELFEYTKLIGIQQ